MTTARYANTKRLWEILIPGGGAGAWMGDPKRGAAMGRETVFKEALCGDPYLFHLRKIRLDSGGYDGGGAYWGLGQPLFGYTTADGSTKGYIRARYRDEAKQLIREDFPNASFKQA